MERYLSTHDAAVELGVTDTAVTNIVRRGELRVAAETRSGIRLFRLDDVRKLAAERGNKGRPGRGSAPPVSAGARGA